MMMVSFNGRTYQHSRMVIPEEAVVSLGEEVATVAKEEAMEVVVLVELKGSLGVLLGMEEVETNQTMPNSLDYKHCCLLLMIVFGLSTGIFL